MFTLFVLTELGAIAAIPRIALVEKLIGDRVLVEMNGLQGASPVFIVHPIQGHVCALSELAKQLPVRAVGVQWTPEIPTRSIEEVASKYMKVFALKCI